MKRDMELFRSIMLNIENTDDFGEPADFAVDRKTFIGHVALIDDAGFLTGVEFDHQLPDEDGCELTLSVISHLRLTNAGHEFIAAARNPTNWETAKATLAGAGQDLGGVTIGVLQGLLVRIMSAGIGL
jgi:hypothetical protein